MCDKISLKQWDLCNSDFCVTKDISFTNKFNAKNFKKAHNNEHTQSKQF